MNRMKALINNYRRSDNIDKFLTFSLSLVGMFIGPLMTLLYSLSPWFVFGGFALSICACMVFSICSFIYVNRWHGMLTTMKHYKHLFAAQAYIAKFQHSIHKNNTYEVKSLTIDYVVGDKYYDSNSKKTYFPFSVEYTVNSIVQTQLTTIYYHMISHKNPSRTDNIAVQFCYYNGTTYTDYQPSRCEENLKNEFSTHMLALSKAMNKGTALNYKIKISFNKEAGLLDGEPNNLLYYPENISSAFALPTNNGKRTNHSESFRDKNTLITVSGPDAFFERFMIPLVRDIRSNDKRDDVNQLSTKEFNKSTDNKYFALINSQKDAFFAFEIDPKQQHKRE